MEKEIVNRVAQSKLMVVDLEVASDMFSMLKIGYLKVWCYVKRSSDKK